VVPIDIYQRYSQTEGQTIDMQWQNRALHYSASRGDDPTND